MAWESPAARPFFRVFFTTWRDVVFAPRAFFAGLDPHGGLLRPLLFAGVCLAVGFLGALWGISELSQVAGGVNAALLVVLTVAVAPGTFIIMFALTVLFLHVLALGFGGNAPLKATTRAVAYGQAGALAELIPAVGSILALVIRLSLYGWGVSAVHGFPTRRAIAFYVTLVVIAGGFIYSAAQLVLPLLPPMR